MKYEEIEAMFANRGWKNEHERTFWKRVRHADEGESRDECGNPVCILNNKLSVHATVSETRIPTVDVDYTTVEFDITGEYAPGLWAKLQVYSVTWEEAGDRLSGIERGLLAAWDALCNVSRPENGDYLEGCTCHLVVREVACPQHGGATEGGV